MPSRPKPVAQINHSNLKKLIIMATNQTNVVITRSPKSMGVGLVLTFLFGSVGLFYSSIIGGETALSGAR